MKRDFPIANGRSSLPAQLRLPGTPRGLVILAQLGEESLAMAADPALAAYGVLSVSLLDAQELQIPDKANNIHLLADRLLHVLDRARMDGDTENLPICLYGGGQTTPAAIRVAARRDAQVRALVCRGGLVDLAGLQYLRLLAAPLLLLLDRDETGAGIAYRHARPHLSSHNESRYLQPGESIGPQLDQWFGQALQAI